MAFLSEEDKLKLFNINEAMRGAGLEELSDQDIQGILQRLSGEGQGPVQAREIGLAPPPQRFTPFGQPSSSGQELPTPGFQGSSVFPNQAGVMLGNPLVGGPGPSGQGMQGQNLSPYGTTIDLSPDGEVQNLRFKLLRRKGLA